MYAFAAFKWGPAWESRQVLVEGKKPKPKPKKPERNCKSKLIIQPEQCAYRYQNHCFSRNPLLFLMTTMDLLQLKYFPL